MDFFEITDRVCFANIRVKRGNGKFWEIAMSSTAMTGWFVILALDFYVIPRLAPCHSLA